MQHPGREACGLALPLDADPHHSDVRQRAERRCVERGATGREHDHQRFVIHWPHCNAAWVSRVTHLRQDGAIQCVRGKR